MTFCFIPIIDAHDQREVAVSLGNFDFKKEPTVEEYMSEDEAIKKIIQNDKDRSYLLWDKERA